MDIKDFIGKVVIGTKTQTRYILTKIHAAYITVGTVKLNAYGTRNSYLFKTDYQDPFTLWKNKKEVISREISASSLRRQAPRSVLEIFGDSPILPQKTAAAYSF